MKIMTRCLGLVGLGALLTTLGVPGKGGNAFAQPANGAPSPDASLPVPKAIHSDRSIPAAQLARTSLAARRYYAFWNTGNPEFAKAALAPDFKDLNLPAGRPQGPEGPLVASRAFRAAVPDLRVEVEEMLLVGDRVIGRLRFRGHFTGTFGEGPQARQGAGQAIEFVATDIYRVRDGRIVENWHLEDNLTLLRQLGVIPG